MFQYRVWDRVLCTDIPFPELLELTDTLATDKSVTITQNASLCDFIGAPYVVWPDDFGQPSVSISRVPAGFLVRLARGALFLIGSDGASIHYHFFADVPLALARRFILHLAMPLSQSLRRVTLLHGSAICADKKVLGLIGKGGRGKSTLASFLVRKRGYSLIADDSLFINSDDSTHYVYPSYNGVYLTARSLQLISDEPTSGLAQDFNEKSHFKLSIFENNPQPLAFLYFLDNNCLGDPVIESIRPADAFLRLVQHCFVLDSDIPASISAQFGRLAFINEHVRCYRLGYARSEGSLERVASSVQAHVLSMQ